MDEQDRYMYEEIIKNLKWRIKRASEQLHCLANEQIHRSNGAPFAEIDAEDLEEVVDILSGKD